MRISAKADYAVRALVVLARHTSPDEGPVTVDRIAREGDIPPRFLEGILAEVRRAGLVDSKRGAEGGYRIARDPADIRVPLERVRWPFERQEQAKGAAGPLAEAEALR